MSALVLFAPDSYNCAVLRVREDIYSCWQVWNRPKIFDRSNYANMIWYRSLPMANFRYLDSVYWWKPPQLTKSTCLKYWPSFPDSRFCPSSFRAASFSLGFSGSAEVSIASFGWSAVFTESESFCTSCFFTSSAIIRFEWVRKLGDYKTDPQHKMMKQTFRSVTF